MFENDKVVKYTELDKTQRNDGLLYAFLEVTCYIL